MFTRAWDSQPSACFLRKLQQEGWWAYHLQQLITSAAYIQKRRRLPRETWISSSRGYEPQEKKVKVNALQAQHAKERDVFATIWELRKTTYSDQMGRFPFTSCRGDEYVMVMVELDSSAILVETLKNRFAEEMLRAYL